MSRYASYVPNYFSIPDILATQEKVPCKFEVEVKDLGMLDRGSNNPHIEVGASMELPFWLVNAVAKTRGKMATVILPSTYSEAQRDILNADESVVDLHKQFFYEVGIYICQLQIPEAPEVSAMLLQAFRARFRRLIMDWAMHAVIDLPGVRRLDQSEERIYYAGKEAALKLNHWLAEGDDLMEAGELVVSHRKRQSGMLAINLD